MLNPLPQRAIPLTTYLGPGHEIPNHIDLDPTPGVIALTRKPHAALLAAIGVRRTGPPTGRYNCHGLVFASRRTNIPPAGSDSNGLIDRILADDQFAQVTEQQAQEGDIVLWRRDREVDHTGVICFVDTQPIRILWAWSMWGGLGEFVHRVPLSPYDGCVHEYWRLS